jgi:hypothetical protein
MAYSMIHLILYTTSSLITSMYHFRKLHEVEAESEDSVLQSESSHVSSDKEIGTYCR